MRALKIVELYAGTARSIEPFRSWRRTDVSLLVDANRFARDTYLLNHPNAPYVARDIASLRPGELLRLAGGRVDILLGCPPCQGFSETGLRLPDDPRNKHVHHFARLAHAVRPLAVVMENVPRVAESIEFANLVRLLENDGYAWTTAIANSVQYGGCQSRQRLLFVAFRGDVGVLPRLKRPTHGGDKKIFSYATLNFRRPSENPVEFFGVTPASQRLSSQMRQDFALKVGKQQAVTLTETLAGLPKIGSEAASKCQHVAWDHSRAMLKRMERVPEGERWKGGLDYYSHAYGRLHRRGFAKTITTFFAYAGSGRFWHPTENRSLTLRESARIQGFSDDFLFQENSKKSAQLVGNALDLPLASICYDAVRSALS